jgi:predicted metal-dependent phosphoesterase TrpH
MKGSADETVRVDLHLHSRASGSATNVWVKGLGDERGVRESYTLPEESYRMAKRAGMDFVTLIDHETIDGALTLLHYPDFLVGEEVSARFPEDGSCADVLLYGLDATSHVEAQNRRSNIYDLVEYLREAGIVHVLAHPMYSITKPLDRVAVEKRLVLFGLWEFVNGSRPASQNRLAREVAENVGALDLKQIALRHGLGAPDHTRIAGTGGSDDHGGIYGGSTFTLIPG